MAKKGKEKEQRLRMVEEKMSSAIEEANGQYSKLDRKLRAYTVQLENYKFKTCIAFAVVAILLVAIIVVGVYQYRELSGRVEALEQEKGNETKSDESREDNESNYENFLNFIFSSDGSLYEPTFSDFIFYSDSDCTKEIQNVKFVSRDSETVWTEDGRHVYCYRMSNGEICYSRQNLYSNDFTECE